LALLRARSAGQGLRARCNLQEAGPARSRAPRISSAKQRPAHGRARDLAQSPARRAAYRAHSGLGQAFRYLLKRWQKLTLFLHVPDAPLENNRDASDATTLVRLAPARKFKRCCGARAPQAPSTSTSSPCRLRRNVRHWHDWAPPQSRCPRRRRRERSEAGAGSEGTGPAAGGSAALGGVASTGGGLGGPPADAAASAGPAPAAAAGSVAPLPGKPPALGTDAAPATLRGGAAATTLPAVTAPSGRTAAGGVGTA
jgi:hypothetical protein